MLELLHSEPNAASARVLIALKEKGLEFESRYVDLLAFEQHAPEFLALNPMGQTPVLVADGEVFTEASFICEYLDEAFPGTPLLAKAPIDRWAARAWQKYVDDYLAAAVSDLAWPVLGLRALKARNSAATLDAALERIPVKERRDAWQAAVAEPEDGLLEKAHERIRLAVEKTEADLEGRDWLAPGGFSLADIAVYAYLAYLPGIAPDLLGDRTAAWLKRVAARPAVKAAETTGRSDDPYGVSAPGPEHIRWG